MRPGLSTNDCIPPCVIATRDGDLDKEPANDSCDLAIAPLCKNTPVTVLNAYYYIIKTKHTVTIFEKYSHNFIKITHNVFG